MEVPTPFAYIREPAAINSPCQRLYRFRALREQPTLIFLRRVFKQESVQFNEVLIAAALYEGF